MPFLLLGSFLVGHYIDDTKGGILGIGLVLIIYGYMVTIKTLANRK